jgi:L-fuculose-phosphate aldolase
MSVGSEPELRREIIKQYCWLKERGLIEGTSGNVSVRLEKRRAQRVRRGNASEAESSASTDASEILITPSSVECDSMRPKMIAKMTLDGAWSGPKQPSSEWRFHVDIMKARPEVNAIVHTHSPYATALSIVGSEIAACHYLIALFGGSNIRCAPYARFGTQELSDYAIVALKDRWGCLLSNHGAIALGKDLLQAIQNAVQLETLAQLFFLSKSIGNINLLSDSQIEEVKMGIQEWKASCSGSTRSPGAAAC